MKVSEMFARRRIDKTLRLIERCISDKAVVFIPGEGGWPGIKNREECLALYDAIRAAGLVPCMYMNVPEADGIVDEVLFSVGRNGASAYDTMSRFMLDPSYRADEAAEMRVRLSELRSSMMEELGISLPEIPPSAQES